MTDYDRLKYRGTFNKLLCDKKRIINFLLKFRRITIDYFDIKDKKKRKNDVRCSASESVSRPINIF